MLGSVRPELRSAFGSIQPVLINLGRPKFEFDSTHVKYGRSEPDPKTNSSCLAAKYNVCKSARFYTYNWSVIVCK